MYHVLWYLTIRPTSSRYSFTRGSGNYKYYGIMSHKVFDAKAMEWIAPSSQALISSCNAKKCVCCKAFDNTPIFTSFSTGRSFILNIPGTFYCKTPNLVYLISCKRCGIQYVGQSKQTLHCRLNGHRSSIMNNKVNTFMSNHFRNNGHNREDLKAQIIDVINDYSSKEDLTEKLNRSEDFFIRHRTHCIH